ncbi:UPF0271 protein [Deinobacterium chartae]|uniref:5-oxoprolinase subunit A n=1 Tax=Deinobacterium chartae TaxID=521158 RepID=A0A841HY80_9DEIO|nr:5-oxoprolinase subunit PxpA [Deinobacterium chartae]MBB6097170.1 UPF0271 protein [Deinobacterium chartae]
MTVDLNCDLGEGFPFDAELIPLATSVNVACGLHAGGWREMERAVALALEAGVAIGAHPGYPDREGFGRRELNLPAPDVYALVLYQLGALEGMVRARGGRLAHVKPHGALYNRAARDLEVARAIARAVADFDADLRLYGLSGSALLDAAAERGLRAVSEVFADRGYRADGTLVPRGEPGALVESPLEAAARVQDMLRFGQVRSVQGPWLRVHAQTVCVHGDGQEALRALCGLRAALEDQGVVLRAP